MSPPLVSIIMRSYNRAYCLDRAINSIISQTFTDWELILVDNCSVDQTHELVHSYGDFRIQMVTIQNHGIIAASFNLGLTHSTGRYIAILDSDDWWSHDKLALSIKPLQDGADLVYHDMVQLCFDDDLILSRQVFRSCRLQSPVFKSLLLNGNLLPCSSVIARRSLLLQIGGFSEDPSIIGAEDYEAWLRLSQITDRFVRVEGPLIYYSWNTSNLSCDRLSIAYCQALSLIYQRHLAKYHLVYPSWMLILLIKAYWSERRDIGLRITLRRVSLPVLSNLQSLCFHPRSIVAFASSLAFHFTTALLSRLRRSNLSLFC